MILLLREGVLASKIKIIFPLKIFSLTQLGQKECDGSLSSKELKKVCMFRKEGGKNNTQPSVNFLNVQTIYN